MVVHDVTNCHLYHALFCILIFKINYDSYFKYHLSLKIKYFTILKKALFDFAL